MINKIENLPMSSLDDDLRWNGRITLMGVVDRDGDKIMAEMKARGGPGAFGVENELTVEIRKLMKAVRAAAICLIGFLAAGAVIAWSTVALAFIRFYRAEGTLLKITNCRFPNPITTPCFYGAIAFGVALVWAASLARRATPRIHGYEGLWWLLLASTIFGWSNVAYEFWRWVQSSTGFIVSCTTESISSPFQSPCLYGATMFLGAWLTAGRMLRVLPSRTQLETDRAASGRQRQRMSPAKDYRANEPERGQATGATAADNGGCAPPQPTFQLSADNR